jgi:hypothetical protein
MGKNLRTEKALIDSGAYVPGDFEDSPMVMKQAEKPARGIGKQVTQAEYDRQLAAGKAKADANRQAQKDKQSRARMRGY